MKINWDIANPTKPPLTTRIWRFIRNCLNYHSIH